MANQRSIVITGAASGIGRATARLFAKAGWSVGMYDRDGAGLARLAAEFDKDRAIVVEGDVMDARRLERIMEEVVARAGALNALVNSAGVLEYANFVDTSAERKRQIVDINAVGVMNAIDAALPMLSATPDSRIITMSSAGAIYGYPHAAVYSASKFFVRGLTEALNIELRPKDIWVCDVMVGFVNTEMVRDPRHGIDLVSAFGITTPPEAVAAVLWEACARKQVHWMVDDDYTARYAASIDSLEWNERHHYVRGMLG